VRAGALSLFDLLQLLFLSAEIAAQPVILAD
jgi:hypothetical protein